MMAKATEQSFEVLSHFTDKMWEAFPNASWDTDNDGQVIIYTGLQWNMDGSVTNFEDIP